MILVFLRRYNDIDHTVPLVYRLALDMPDEQIVVLALKPTLKIFDDFRLEFLKKFKNVRIDYAHRFLSSTLYEYLLFTLINLGTRFPLQKKPSEFRRLLRRVAFELVQYCRASRRFGHAWAKKAFQRYQPKVIIMDRHEPKSFSVVELLETAREQNIPIIGVPHGLHLATNADIMSNSVEDFGNSWRYLDHIVSPFEHYKQAVVKHNAPANKIHVLGSTRFCQEWRDIYQEIVPKFPDDLPKKSDRLNIVLMDHSAIYKMNPTAIMATIDRLRQLDFINLLIKPSTSTLGDSGARSIGTISADKLLTYNCIASPRLTSFELIQWADAVLCTVSSIALEVLLQNKPLIYPIYFHQNEMLFESRQACWQVNSCKELEDALKILYEDRHYRPYREEAAQQFLTEVVYGGIHHRDVLGDNVALIKQVIKNEQKLAIEAKN